MSDQVTQDPTPQRWQDRIAELWWLNKVGDYSLQLAKDEAEFQTIRRLMRKQQNGTLGKPDGPDDGEDDELGVSVGNTVNYYQGASGGGGDSTVSQAPGRQTAGTLAKVATAAALVAGGAGAGVVTNQILQPDDDKPAAVDTDTDTDTTYSLGIFKEEQ